MIDNANAIIGRGKGSGAEKVPGTAPGTVESNCLNSSATTGNPAHPNVRCSVKNHQRPLDPQPRKTDTEVGTYEQVPGLPSHPADNYELTCFGQGSGNSGLCADRT
jgi:hypothetical protein